MHGTRWQSGEDVAKDMAAEPEDPRLFLIRRRAATGTYDEATASDVAYLLNRLDIQDREINNLTYAADVNFRKWREAQQKVDTHERELLRLVKLVADYRLLYQLMVSVDGQYDIEEKLRGAFNDDTEDLSEWAEWATLMDSQTGVEAQFNQVGIFAPEQVQAK